MEENQFNFDFSLEDFSFDEEYENQHEEEILEQDDDTEKDNSVENDEHSEEVDGEDNEEEDDNDDSDDDADNDDSSSDIYSSLALFAQESGILSSSLELSKDKIKSPEDLANLLNEEAEARALQKLEEKISGIDLEKIAQIRHEINDVSSLTEENFKNDIDLAKRIVEQDLQNQKLPERVIKNYMRRLVDSDDDAIIEEALNSRESIINYNRLREEEELTRQEQERQARIKSAEEDLKKLQSAIYDTKELLPGFIPNKTIRDKVFEHITTAVAKDKDGNPITRLVKDSYDDPIGFQIRLHAFYELTDGFRNLDKIGARQKSNAVKDLERAFKDRPNYNTGASYKIDKNSYDSPLKYDELNL